MILSGPGRCRLFRAVVGDDDFYNRFLDIHETRQMTDPSIAGAHISKLSNMRVDSAVNTDRLFGKILAQATLILCQASPRRCSARGTAHLPGRQAVLRAALLRPVGPEPPGNIGHHELHAAFGH